MTKSISAKRAAPRALNDASLKRAALILSERDADLARVLEDFGPPLMWEREQGFHTLVHIMLEQQVSLASAQAAYDRLLAAASPLTPERFLELDDATLRAAGFSRQKTAYVRDLALAIVEGRLDLKGLEKMDDDDVSAELTKIKGVGRWTADIYLLRALLRPDAWPAGDLALAIAAERIRRLPARPSPRELDEMSAPWRPWRAVAARLLWNFYLHTPKRLGNTPTPS